MNQIRTVFKNKWVKITEEEFQRPGGFQGSYVVVERIPGVLILPIEKSNEEVFTYLVKQYRYPIDREVWQFPMGGLDSGDNLENAKRELREETGLEAASWKFITEYYVDPGLSRQVCFVYVAEDVVRKGEQDLEESERGMEVKRFSLREVELLMEQGEIRDMWMYTGIFLLKRYLSNSK